MAVAFVGGAALGAAFGELLHAVDSAAIKAVKFKSILEDLKSMLNRIAPMFEEIDKLNRELGRSEEETKMFTDRLREGLKLVRKCEKVRWWNYCKKSCYAHKLKDLEDSLAKFFQIDVQAQMTVDNKKILGMVTQVAAKLGGGKGFAGWCEVPEVPEFVVGFEEPLQELKTMMLEGAEQVVVISAPGGCGKSTLAKMLCRHQQIKDKFKDNIFFVTFSKKPNLEVIIEKLFQHKGYLVPRFQTDEEAINQLEHMLNQTGPSPILLVLDDVWSGSESKIEKFKFKIPEYKILVTSRSVFRRSSFITYKLKLLKDQDAMALFRHAAFEKDGSCFIPDDIVNKIVSGCGGFPLALKVVGGSLSGQPEVRWKQTLEQWSGGQSIFYSIDAPDEENELFICLQTSLDALDEKIKECYLDLASFPEDQRIPATALMDMWVELYNLNEDDAFANLHKLSNRNLLDLVLTRKDASEINGYYYNEHFVMQHDLLRELAIHWIAQNPIEQRSRLIIDMRGNNLPRWWIEQRQHPIHARLASISTDEMSKEYNMQLNKVEVLLLNIQARNCTLPLFMENMNQLKVLIVTNYGVCSAEISNFPLLGRVSSLKRIRLEHVSISSISKTMLKLKNLQKISLVMCKFDEAFGNCTIQIADMLPNLVEIVIDYCSDLEEFPAWLCNIRCLQKLNISNCHELIALPEGFGMMENLEVLRLHACTKLLELPKSIGSLQKLRFLDLSDCISISKLPGRIGELCGLRKLHMRGCRGLSDLPSTVKDLKQLEDLTCDEETAYLWEHYKVHLPDLKLNVLKEDANLNWLPDIHP